MAYQHLGLNFGHGGLHGGSASSATLSSQAARARPRININDLLNVDPNQRGPPSNSAPSQSQEIAAEVTQLRAQINSLNQNMPQPMYASQAEIERVRAAVASTQTQSKKTLKPVVPGHKSNALTTGKYSSPVTALFLVHVCVELGISLESGVSQSPPLLSVSG
ncbi:hypothetical protein B0H13DRAFT_1859277 [Mycena leptocephala]|nr:hypothetical protein B0H13DRAFT_1859277 [Mycena leptocephala]